MVFEGGYHGGVFFFATAAGSPINAPFPTRDRPTTTTPRARARLIAEHADELAAVIVEPLQGSGGCIPADQGFLEALREATTEHGVAADLRRGDDVAAVAGRPAARDGRHARPDVARQVLGGGLHVRRVRRPRRPDGAVRPDPADALPHAGTFNNNVLTMAAGLAGLTQILHAGCGRGAERRRRRAPGAPHGGRRGP